MRNTEKPTKLNKKTITEKTQLALNYLSKYSMTLVKAPLQDTRNKQYKVL